MTIRNVPLRQAPKKFQKVVTGPASLGFVPAEPEAVTAQMDALKAQAQSPETQSQIKRLARYDAALERLAESQTTYAGSPSGKRSALARTWGAGGMPVLDRNTVIGAGPNSGDISGLPHSWTGDGAGPGGANPPAAPMAALEAALSTALRDKLVAAVKHSVEEFRKLAYFDDVTIMASVAIGAPGCLKGPSLEPLIATAPGVAALTGAHGTLRDAVARSVGALFDGWRSNVTIPGFAFYPAFAAVPAPQAPPTPNVPFPLAIMVSAKSEPLCSPLKQRTRFLAELGATGTSPTSPLGVFAANLAAIFGPGFATWLLASMPMMVIGKGPCPAFNPPNVPTAPVVGGDVIPSPGHLSASTAIVFVPIPLILP